MIIPWPARPSDTPIIPAVWEVREEGKSLGLPGLQWVQVHHISKLNLKKKPRFKANCTIDKESYNGSSPTLIKQSLRMAVGESCSFPHMCICKWDGVQVSWDYVKSTETSLRWQRRIYIRLEQILLKFQTPKEGFKDIYLSVSLSVCLPKNWIPIWNEKVLSSWDWSTILF